MHFLLMYEFVEGYLERRAPFRNTHLSLAWKANERGDLVLAGALAEPADAAVFVFQGDGPGRARAFAEADPYVVNGLVKKWTVRPWTTVVGKEASSPVRPNGA